VWVPKKDVQGSSLQPLLASTSTPQRKLKEQKKTRRYLLREEMGREERRGEERRKEREVCQQQCRILV